MNNIINPNEYGSLLYDKKEKEYLNNVINQRRIFRYSRCDYPYSSLCEEKIKELVGSKYCLTITNGTSALKTALIGLGVERNDRVLISSYTFLATALAPIAIGAIPIPIEVDLNTGLDLNDLEKELKKGCKAIIVVHFQGRTFNLNEVKKLAKKYNVKVIEDACQAFASNYKGKYAGTQADIGVYSFQQYKQLSSGEGGAIVTNNKKVYERMRNYTDMGSKRDRFPNWNDKDVLFGENYRMNNLVAAVLYAQLEKLNNILDKQKSSRDRIMKTLKDNKIKNIIESTDPNGDTSMNILIYLNNKEDKQDIISLGKDNNIELRNMWSSLYYDNNLFKNNKLTSKSLKGKDCIKTRDLIERMIVISIPPVLTKSNEKTISDFIINLKKNKYME